MPVDIRVPTLGESVTEATIAQWFKAPGETVQADEPLVELETDKVTVEVPAPASGVLSEILVLDGETVEVGAILGAIGEANGDASLTMIVKEEPKVEADPAPVASAGGADIDVVVPTLGESVTEATVAQWYKAEGDSIAVDEPLVELETDKVAVEVAAVSAGTLSKISVAVDETVEVGAVLGVISGGGVSAAPVAQTAAPEAQPKPEASKSSDTPLVNDAPLAPSVRKIVAENDLEVSTLAGSGKDGRITKADALAALEAKSQQAATPVAAKAPPAKPAQPGTRARADREERVPMTRLRRTIAARLKESQNKAAMLTTFNEVDMTDVMAVRAQYKELFEKKHGVKLGFMSFFVKACVVALRDIPAVNGEIEGDDVIYKNYYDIGVAVGTEKGLVVPVVRDTDQKSLAQIEKDINDFGRRARDGALKIDELQGGTFTISNGGVYGSLMSTPILNQPQSGILGMHKIQERPVAIDGQIEIRPMMYLALSYDHRIIDGKEAVTFLVRVKQCLEEPERLILDL